MSVVVRGRGGRAARAWLAPAVVWIASFLGYVAWSWRPAWSMDEAATAVVVRGSWGAVWRLALDDIALGPYYLAIKPWALVSTSPVWLRLPSVIAAATAVTVLFVAVRRIVDARTAVATAAAMVIVPGMTRYGQDARPYALAVLACVAAVVCWWAYLRRGRWGYAAGLVAALVAAGLLHVYALLVIPVLVIAVTAAPLRSRRGDLVRTVVPSLVALVLLSPFLRLASTGARGSPNPAPVTPTNLAETFLWLVTTGRSRLVAVGGAAFVLVAVGGYVVGWVARGQVRTLAVLAAAWLVAPPAGLTLLQVVTGKPGVVTRYWSFGLPALAVGVGLALGAVAVRHLVVMVAALAVWAGLSLPAHISIRGVDGHYGLRYQTIPAVLDLPALASLPVLIQSSDYRGLVANDPQFPASRIPLIVDTPARGPVDPVHPQPVGSGSAQFQAMVRGAPVVIAYQYRRQKGGLPTAAAFRSFPLPSALSVYDEPVVLCDYFGDALGVFAQQPDAVPAASREELARRIEALNPARITCSAALPAQP